MKLTVNALTNSCFSTFKCDSMISKTKKSKSILKNLQASYKSLWFLSLQRYSNVLHLLIQLTKIYLNEPEQRYSNVLHLYLL